MADRRVPPETIVVIGLGRFGMAMATELIDQRHEVLGIDVDARLVQVAADTLTHVVQADATDESALRQLGVAEVQHAVVAIGDAIQASILATAALADLEVPDIWAKAQTDQHRTILERVGAHHVVYPERDMGRRVAHRVTSTNRIVDYFEIDESFALVETEVPRQMVGSTLAESGIRHRYNVNVVAVKPEHLRFVHPEPGTRLEPRMLLLVGGRVADVEAFARLA